MLLRSSSTPVLGNLIPFSDPPNRIDRETIHNKNITKKPPLPHDRHNNIHHTRISFSSSLNVTTSFSCNSSPIREFCNNKDFIQKHSLRRVRSDGDFVAFSAAADEETRAMLHKAPSLSVFNDPSSSSDGLGEVKDSLERTVTVGEAINEAAEEEFSFREKGMGQIEEEDEEELGEVQNLGFGEEVVERSIGSPPLCIASGIGIGGVGLDPSLENLNEGGDLEEYYEKMVEQCPFHPIFLRNYAQLLQSKGDLHGAEEYYSRASLADPEDGEIWMQYAKLVWELHRDRDRASSYFKLATELAPQDCNVLAAHASFLWEEDDEEEVEADFSVFLVSQKESIDELGLNVAGGVMIGAPDSITDVPRKSENLEDYYRKMIEENPNNPLFLSNYAKFLYEPKRDLQGAEEYYLRAVLAEPGDGEITAEYAKLVWELHHDGHKASIYFERAVQASPENSHVLAAYASFLWQNEEDEEDGCRQETQVQVPHFHEQTMSTANM